MDRRLRVIADKQREYAQREREREIHKTRSEKETDSWTED